MIGPDDERVAEYAFDLLPPEERRQVADQIAASPELAREVATLAEELAVTLPPVAPPPEARARLLDALAGPDRFRPFFAEIGRLFDLGSGAVRALLARIDEPSAWEGSPLPLVELIHFRPGPAVTAVDAGFVRIAAGTAFPRHRHLGDEVAVVLEGTLRDSGRTYLPGAVVRWPADSVHDYEAGAGRDLVLMVAHSGIELLS